LYYGKSESIRREYIQIVSLAAGEEVTIVLDFLEAFSGRFLNSHSVSWDLHLAFHKVRTIAETLSVVVRRAQAVSDAAVAIVNDLAAANLPDPSGMTW
jgi:hypothetical protein